MQSILTPPNLYTISFNLPTVKYNFADKRTPLPPPIVIRIGYSDVEGVESRFVPVPKIKKTPLRWCRCGSCMCVGTLKRKENVARHYVPAPCTIAMQIEEGNNPSDEGE